MAARKVSKKALPAIALAAIVLLAWSALGGEGGNPADVPEPAPGVTAATVQEAEDGGAESASVDEPAQEEAPAVPEEPAEAAQPAADRTVDEAGLPAYDGSSSRVTWGDGVPDFTDAELAMPAGTVKLSPLDSLGRVGAAFAVVGVDTMPTEERGDLGDVEPTGWRQAQYSWIDNGGWLYNRCHLLAHSLCSLDDDVENLMTGTRSMNLAMLDFEMRVKDYVEVTGNHVAYRVTPCFVGSELLARGVRMEARSVEDGGSGVSFDLFAFNVEPGVQVDYATGASCADGTRGAAQSGGEAGATQSEAADWVLNVNSGKIHHPGCGSVGDMSPKNRRDVHATLEELEAQGYEPCGRCF